MTSDTPDTPTPLSVEYDLSAASEKAQTVVFAANDAQCSALAKRFDLKGLRDFDAKFEVSPHIQGYQIEGTASAEVTQLCVISGADVVSRTTAPINMLLWSAPIDGELDALEEAYQVDEIEPIEDSIYDLGELAAQYLGLAIDPFPRAHGASLNAEVSQNSSSPFSILQQLKDKA